MELCNVFHTDKTHTMFVDQLERNAALNLMVDLAKEVTEEYLAPYEYPWLQAYYTPGNPESNMVAKVVIYSDFISTQTFFVEKVV